MDPILQEFERDLDRITSQIDLIEELKTFSGHEITDDERTAGGNFFNISQSLHSSVRHIHSNLPIISGTLVLYGCGRFEELARTLFEDLCQRLTSRAGEFSKLPKKMRENLPVFTAKIIENPRKYGHAEGGVRTFVTTLASNLTVGNRLERVNHECLSITDANMKSDVLADLFGRVGVSAVWRQISEQASMRAFFQSQDAGKVETDAKRTLNELMDLRNKIAHPSGTLEWPSTNSLKSSFEFLRLLARAISDLVGVYEVTLCQTETAPQAAQA